MDIETKDVQHVSSPKESDLTTWQTYTPIPSLKTLFSLFSLYSLFNVSSCAATGDLTWKMFCHRDDIWRVSFPCVFCDASSVRQIGQTSSDSRARNTRKVSRQCESSCEPWGGNSWCRPCRSRGSCKNVSSCSWGTKLGQTSDWTQKGRLVYHHLHLHYHYQHLVYHYPNT